jgi:hypothetical protein
MLGQMSGQVIISREASDVDLVFVYGEGLSGSRLIAESDSQEAGACRRTLSGITVGLLIVLRCTLLSRQRHYNDNDSVVKGPASVELL